MADQDQVRQMPNPDDFGKLTLGQCKPLEEVFVKGLADKVAIVTGGATGLGYNVAPGGMVSHGALFEGRANGAKYGEEYAAFKKERQQAVQVPVAFNPDEVALVCYALCTPMSDFMDGATIDVNGGALLNAQLKPFSYTVEGCIPGPSAE